MKKLLDYLNAIPLGDRDEFARRCETSFDYLRQIGYGNRACRPMLGVHIERETQGVITRKELFEDDWPKLWPELVEKAPA